MTITHETLIQKAKTVAAQAYAPYSSFHVGACVLLDSGETFCGCNVENASYGLCLCAERAALAAWVASGRGGSVQAIAIVARERPLCVPCGACRQWLAEFSTRQKRDITIVLENDDGSPAVFSTADMLPHAFSL